MVKILGPKYHPDWKLCFICCYFKIYLFVLQVRNFLLIPVKPLWKWVISLECIKSCFCWIKMHVFLLFVHLFSQVRMQALKCFSVLAFENPQVSMTLVNGRLDLSVALMWFNFWPLIPVSKNFFTDIFCFIFSFSWWRIVTTDICEDVTER